MRSIDRAVDEFEFWENIEDYEREINSIFSGDNDLTKSFAAIPAPTKKTVADFGCGPGNALKYFNRFKQVFAVDFSPNMLNQARSNNHAQGNIEYFRDDIKLVRLPEKVNLSISVNSIFPHSYHEFDDFFKNILFNTEEGGMILLLLPSFESYTFHLQMLAVKRFSEEPDPKFVSQELAAIFEQLNYTPQGFILSDLNRVQKKWLKEEVEFRLSLYGLQRVSVAKMAYHTENTAIPNHKRWYWMVTIIK